MSERKVSEDQVKVWKELRARHANAEKFVEQHCHVELLPAPADDFFHLRVLQTIMNDGCKFSADVMREVEKLAASFRDSW
eukprot:6200455-Lingulodinium_polyedra.AAC.1